MSYDSRSLAYCLHGASEKDDDLYVMINAYWEPLDFTIQEGSPGEWLRVVDTSLASPHDIAADGSEKALNTMDYPVAARSVGGIAEEANMTWGEGNQPQRKRQEEKTKRREEINHQDTKTPRIQRIQKYQSQRHEDTKKGRLREEINHQDTKTPRIQRIQRNQSQRARRHKEEKIGRREEKRRI